MQDIGLRSMQKNHQLKDFFFFNKWLSGEKSYSDEAHLNMTEEDIFNGSQEYEEIEICSKHRQKKDIHNTL